MSWHDNLEHLKNTISGSITSCSFVGKEDNRPVIVPQEEVIVSPSGVNVGDYTTNVAFQLARRVGLAPQKVAETICKNVIDLPDSIEKVEFAKTGHINFTISARSLQDQIAIILEQGSEYSRQEVGAGKKIHLEFVSANPTGPLNVVSARAAAIGDALARLLGRIGYEVTKEYYVNDHGRQVRLLGESLLARLKQARGEKAEMPEGGYQGEYLSEMAAEIAAAAGEDSPQALSAAAVKKFISLHRESLDGYGVSFDNWFYESKLHADGLPQQAMDELTEKGHTYQKDGAVWFKSTDFGDAQDWVFRRSDAEGSLTYHPIDVAYHRHKYQRGYDRMIDLWGPDHHAHVAVTKAGVAALGYQLDKLDIIIVQQVNLIRGGQKVKMSKRAGEFETMDDLVREVGRDAARYFFLMRSMDAPMDFDLDLAVAKSEKNPVYYVQYAHTRVCSILREAKEREDGFYLRDNAAPDLRLLVEAAELALIRKLNYYPQTVRSSAENLEPHRLPVYLAELATVFHKFYAVCRVLDSENIELSRARLALARATKTILADGLGLLGVSAPERM